MDFLSITQFSFMRVNKPLALFFSVLFFSCIPFPVYAGQASEFYIHFSLIFIIGLSLPILLLLIQAHALMRWQHFVFITLSALILLYFLANIEQFQLPFVVSAAYLYLASISMLVFSFDYDDVEKPNNLVQKKSFIKKTIILCTGLYLIALWFLPQFDVVSSWILFSSILLILMLISIIQLIRNLGLATPIIIYCFTQWALLCTFSGVSYLWLENPLVTSYNLVLLTVISFTFVVINICWLLVKQNSRITPKNADLKTISEAELFTYTHDPATNLPTAQQALKYFNLALKSQKDKKFAVVVFKPVNFQQVNTLLGHHNSDILLLQLAYCLQRNIEDNHSLLSFDHSIKPIKLARLQSLHFLVIFDLTTSKYETKQVINDLCKQLSNAVPNAMSFKSFSLNFELAFGVAISGEHGLNVNEIISHAGDALLDAEMKQQQICYFDNRTLFYTEQKLVRMESLRKEILDQNLRWYLQPQININNNQIIGFELMVHWYENPNEEPLTLPEFIDIAEHSGEVYLLTKQMFTQAFEALSVMHKMSVFKKISINLSSVSLLEPDLVYFIEQQMAHYEIASKYLTIEFSEQVLLSSAHRSKSIIGQVKQLGINIAIADFSGSYESLRYLRKMEIDQIKINCQQLAKPNTSHTDKAIINALVTLTLGMDLPLIGTNIDTHEASSAFITMGGTFVQGDVVNRGVTPEEIEVWLNKWFVQYPEL